MSKLNQSLMNLRMLTLWCFIIVISAPLKGQQLSPERIKSLANQYAKASIPEYLEFLTIPNDAFRSETMDENMQWAEVAFQKRGFQTQRLKTGGLDWVFAEQQFPGAKETVLFYMHIDGQAVDPSKWDQPNPYQPVLKAASTEVPGWNPIDINLLNGEINPEWRVFARSAADAKGPVLMFLAAIDAIQSVGVTPTYNIKIIMDSEEEQRADHLEESVTQHQAVLAADKLVILDGPVHLSGKPTLVFGARGIAAIRITTYGPRTPQHSGHYGNYAPNPALRLSQILASMKDEDGRVIIDGFYDGITLSDEVKNELAAVPDDETEIRRKLGIGATDLVGANLQEALQYPSLNIRGMGAGWIGSKVRTIIPAAAVAHLDIRLVKECDPERLVALVRKHIEDMGYHLVDSEPTDEDRMKYPRLASMYGKVAYEAFRTDLDTEIGHWLTAALQHTFGEHPVKVRTLGGSVPISPFVNLLEVPGVILPLVNADNNQHSPNENLRLGNYIDGVRSLIGVLNQPQVGK